MKNVSMYVTKKICFIVIIFCSALITSCKKEIEVIKEVQIPHIGATQKATYFQVFTALTPSVTDSLMPRYALKVSTLQNVDSIAFEYRCISVNRTFSDVVIPRDEFVLTTKSQFLSDSSTVYIYTAKKKFGRYVPGLLGPGVVQSTLYTTTWVKLSSTYTINGRTYKREAEDFNSLALSSSPTLWGNCTLHSL